ncbi:asparagine synthase-related protein [Halomonas sp. RA08-2]|uniref:asparagine synthase-related protein n=1 Tax=Halomonas sp. RA08-2 TaxID=3440842 RepID=UPI003EE9E173
MTHFVARVFKRDGRFGFFSKLVSKDLYIFECMKGGLASYSPSPINSRVEKIVSGPGFELFIDFPSKMHESSYYEDSECLILISGECRRIGGSEMVMPHELVSCVRNQECVWFGGYYLIFAYDKKRRKALIWNTLSRAVPAYVGSYDGETVISNRASLVSAVLERGRPVIDKQSFFPFAFQGFFPSDQCQFKNVSVVPANTLTLATEAGFEHKDIDNSLYNFSADNASDEAFDEIASVLSHSCAFGAEDGIELGLTGGKDSRLIAAALKKAGKDFRAYTIGDKNHPDVTIGAEVAKTLGVPHKVVTRKGESHGETVTVDPKLSTLITLYCSDWTVFGYDRIGSLSTRYNDNPLFKGSGGEMLRGGYPSVLKRGLFNKAKLKFESFWKDHGLLKGDALSRFFDAKSRSFAEIEGMDGIDALDKMYLLYRNGRWGSATYMSSHNRRQIIPFMDNQLLKLIYKLPGEIRVGQYLYYELLKRYSNDLVKVPYFAKTYPFVKDPIEQYRSVAEGLPRPVLGDQKSSSLFNWRFELASDLGGMMKDEILLVFENEFSDIVEISKVKDFIEYCIHKGEDRACGKALWGMYSTALAACPRVPDSANDSHPIMIRKRAVHHF